MKNLVIYDEQGFVLDSRSGSDLREPVGVPFLYIEIPEGKKVKDGIGVDVTKTPHEVILEDIPPSETQILNQGLTEASMLIATQQQQIDMQNAAISELTMLVSIQLLGGNE